MATNSKALDAQIADLERRRQELEREKSELERQLEAARKRQPPIELPRRTVVHGATTTITAAVHASVPKDCYYEWEVAGYPNLSRTTSTPRVDLDTSALPPGEHTISVTARAPGPAFGQVVGQLTPPAERRRREREREALEEAVLEEAVLEEGAEALAQEAREEAVLEAVDEAVAKEVAAADAARKKSATLRPARNAPTSTNTQSRPRGRGLSDRGSKSTR